MSFVAKRYISVIVNFRYLRLNLKWYNTNPILSYPILSFYEGGMHVKGSICYYPMVALL